MSKGILSMVPHLLNSLKESMRVHLRGDVSAGLFSKLLLKIWDGKYPKSDGRVTVPVGLGSVVTALAELPARIYPGVADITEKSMDWTCGRAILTPKNDKAASLNNTLLKSLVGPQMEFKSVDSVVQTDHAVHNPAEFLNTLSPPGIRDHMLLLKVGAPVSTAQP